MDFESTKMEQAFETAKWQARVHVQVLITALEAYANSEDIYSGEEDERVFEQPYVALMAVLAE